MSCDRTGPRKVIPAALQVEEAALAEQHGGRCDGRGGQSGPKTVDPVWVGWPWVAGWVPRGYKQPAAGTLALA